MAYCDISKLTVPAQSSLRTVMQCVNASARQIALVIDNEGRLAGTITDGDIRRAILDSLPLESPVSALLVEKKIKIPITAEIGTDEKDLLQLMRNHSVRHIPLLNTNGIPEDLVTLEQLLPKTVPPMRAVIMAGGFGSRLRPLTDEIPKPMLPVGGTPLMELTLSRIRNAGIRRVNVTTHYKPEKIIEYFGDGEKFGLELKYVNEECPLGTAGSLALIEEAPEALLVINGDILTDTDFKAMLEFHQEHTASLTIAVRKYDFSVPYGVVEIDGEVGVQKLVEKPTFSVFVNAGIYLLAPEVRPFIPRDGKRLDMTDLIAILLERKQRVISFPLHEYWLDIGQPDHYVQAQEDIRKMRAHS